MVSMSLSLNMYMFIYVWAGGGGGDEKCITHIRRRNNLGVEQTPTKDYKRRVFQSVMVIRTTYNYKRMNV